MKFIKKFTTLVVCMFMFVFSGINLNLIIADAANNVPNNDVPVYTDGNGGNANNDEVYNSYYDKTNDLFDAGGFTGEDETGLASTFGYYIQLVVKFIINLCIYIFAGCVTLICFVDAVCIPFPLVANFFATHVPIQLFSNECAEVTGITFSPGADSNSNGGGLGNGGGAAGENASVGDKYKMYVKKRAVSLIFSGLLMSITYTGLLSSLLTKAVSFLASILGKL